MTPPLPPPGYELVEDEPRCGDKARIRDTWELVHEDRDIWLHVFDCLAVIPARDLRWIARKK